MQGSPSPDDEHGVRFRITLDYEARWQGVAELEEKHENWTSRHATFSRGDKRTELRSEGVTSTKTS